MHLIWQSNLWRTVLYKALSGFLSMPESGALLEQDLTLQSQSITKKQSRPII